MKTRHSRLMATVVLGLLCLGAAHAACTTQSRSEQLALVLCSPGTDRASLQAAGEAACQGKAVCNAWIWEDAARVPPKAPATDRELPKTATGSARAVWVHDSRHLMELRKAR